MCLIADVGESQRKSALKNSVIGQKHPGTGRFQVILWLDFLAIF
jgi:hypothetical protein